MRLGLFKQSSRTSSSIPGMVLEQLQDGQHDIIHIAEARGLQAWQILDRSEGAGCRQLQDGHHDVSDIAEADGPQKN